MLYTAVLVQTFIKTVLCLKSSSFLLREGFEVSSCSTIETNHARNNLQCASRCLSYDDCEVASFDKETSICILHGKSNLSFSNNSQYEVMEMTGRKKTVSENQMTNMTTETAGTSQATLALETTAASLTTTAVKTTVTPMTSETKNWTALGADDCFPSTSLEYSGTFSRTISGIPCQYWNQNYNPHYIWNLPEDTTAHNTNYCRETTNREGSPVCYTSDPNVEWEYCFIVKCDACGVDARLPPVPVGTTYGFQVGKNIGMKFTCDSLAPGTSMEHCPVSVCGDDDQWTTDYSVSCSTEDCYTISSAYSGKVTCTVSGRPCMIWSVAGRATPTGPDRNTNYCRDPDNTGKPWCYVSTSPNIVWDYCPVPKC